MSAVVQAMSAARSSSEVLYVRVAGLWRRVLAAAVDFLVLVPVFFLGGAGVKLVISVPLPPLRSDWLDYGIGLLVERHPLLIAVTLLAALIALLYQFTFCALGRGTLGQRALGLRVVTRLGAAPTLTTAALRTLGFILAALPLGLGLLWMGFDREKRGLHDYVAGTFVVSEARGEPS